jgi:hypothetical protein
MYSEETNFLICTQKLVLSFLSKQVIQQFLSTDGVSDTL